jgi:hypothetical protein
MYIQCTSLILTEVINSDGYMSQLLRVLFIGFVLLLFWAVKKIAQV